VTTNHALVPHVHVAGRLPALLALGDLVADLTVWAVLVPEALAYASIAGVSPVVGLYAAPAALAFSAAFGSSKHLVVSPMAATAALSAAAVADSAARTGAGVGHLDTVHSSVDSACARSQRTGAPERRPTARNRGIVGSV
jgi:MFS superfamily sulfate permease-like transporter